MELIEFIRESIKEDVGPGDYSSMSCISASAKSKARLLVKDDGIIAGVELALLIMQNRPELDVNVLINDGRGVRKGDVVFTVSWKVSFYTESRAIIAELYATHEWHCNYNGSLC